MTAGVAAGVLLFCASLLLVDRGFFWVDDFQTNNLPGWCEVARAWRAGEFPLLSGSSWRAGALAAEFPYGVFSPVLTGCSLLVFGLRLSLPAAAATFAGGHLAVLAAGAFRLARRRGLAVDLALVVALVSSLNGWMVLWGARGWLPCLVSGAWLPWVWWGLERARDGRGGARFLPAGIFLYLLITAGWPLTVLMAGLLSAWLAARALAEGRRRSPLWPLPAAWAVGLGLSAPAWLMLLEYMPHTLRGQVRSLAADPTWTVPLSSLPGLIFPGLVTRWNVYGTWKPHLSAELCGGLVPVAFLAASLVRGRARSLVRSLRWEWGLLVLAFVLMVTPSRGNFRWSFRWLPFFFLVLGLLAAQSLALARTWTASAPGRGRRVAGGPRPGGWAVGLFLAVWFVALAGVAPTRTTWPLGLGLGAVCYLWYELEKRLPPASGARPWVPPAVAALSCWLTYVHFPPFAEVPTWKLGEQVRRPAPLDPAVRYLSVHLWPDVFRGGAPAFPPRVTGLAPALYPGNTAMYSGLDFVNGYSPFGPRGLDEVFQFGLHGYFHPEGAARVLAAETGPHGLLELAGVDGLVLADRFAGYRPALVAQGWEEVARVAGGTVFRRAGPPSTRVRAVERAEVAADRTEVLHRLLHREPSSPTPLILLGGADPLPSGPRLFAPARVAVVEETRNRVVADVAARAEREGLLVVFSRPWFPGYRASCNGQPVPVETLDLILPAVRLPAGTRGRLVLEYRPRSLVLGLWLAGATAFLAAGALGAAGWQRYRRGRRAVGKVASPSTLDVRRPPFPESGGASCG